MIQALIERLQNLIESKFTGTITLTLYKGVISSKLKIEHSESLKGSE